MNYCKDCAHFKIKKDSSRPLIENIRYGECTLAIKNPGETLVSPELTGYHYASVIRQSKCEGDCGKEGAFFTAKGEL